MTISVTTQALDRPDLRLRASAVVAGLVGWLAYTRFLTSLQSSHLTLPPCPFYFVTGHPCPFCGGTRSFAEVWQGHLWESVRLYPLGPLLFVATVLAIAYGLTVVYSGRMISLVVPTRVKQSLIGLGLGVLGASWILKLVWLGN